MPVLRQPVESALFSLAQCSNKAEESAELAGKGRGRCTVRQGDKRLLAQRLPPSFPALSPQNCMPFFIFDIASPDHLTLDPVDHDCENLDEARQDALETLRESVPLEPADV
jgi:hypothetical protein